MTALARTGWRTLSLAEFANPRTARHGMEAGRAIAYPFGAVDTRIATRARAVGYELGFEGVNGTSDVLRLARVPVYVWDLGDTPFGLRTDSLGRAGRVVAHVANR